MKIGQTVELQHPQISGADLAGTYIAEELHLHWGTHKLAGSEHRINGKKHDVEMHVVHRSSIYSDLQTAASNPEGLAVLAVMIDFSKVPQSPEKQGIEEFFRHLHEIREFQSTTYANSSLTLGSILFNLDLNAYYTYHGSLTTPGCYESVHWIVFPKPILINPKSGFNVFLLKYENGKKMINTNR
ncbi:hypothetical protein KR093_003867, partial [Drosophila rubida]